MILITDSLIDIMMMKLYALEIYQEFSSEAKSFDGENLILKQRLKVAFLNRYIGFESKIKNSINSYLYKDSLIEKYYNRDILNELIEKIDKKHKRVVEEMRRISCADLKNETTNFLPTINIVNELINDIIHSPEVMYFYRMCTFCIVFEGPDKTGKTTLLNQFKEFLSSKHMNFMQRNVDVIRHVDDNEKEIMKLFLDLTKQEDRLIFQNRMFNKINENVYKSMIRKCKFSQNILMDRSLLSNLIYAYTMLDEEHFIKYLYSNWEFSKGINLNNESEYINRKQNESENSNIFDSLTPKELILYSKEENYQNPVIDLNIEDTLDLNRDIGIDPFLYKENKKKSGIKFVKTKQLMKIVNKAMNVYVTNILYIKNNNSFGYCYEDKIEENSDQRKITEFFKIFKNINSLLDFDREIFFEENSIENENYKSKMVKKFKIKDGYNLSFDLSFLILKSINASFNNTGSSLNVNIVYDDSMDSVTDTFNNAIDKIREINYNHYVQEKENEKLNNNVIN